MAWGKKKPTTLKVNHSIDDVENLVINAAIMMALILSFVAGLMCTPGSDTFDQLNFREAMYEWPNDGFANFVIWTLQSTGAEDSFELEKGKTLNVSEIILRRLPYTYGQGGKHLFTDPDPEMEVALGLAYPNIPIERVHAFFHLYPEDIAQCTLYSALFYNCLIIASVILVVGVVVSMIAYMSLVMSDAREDESGKVLAEWSKWGVPVTVGLYFSVLVAMVLFLIAVGDFIFFQDLSPFNFGKTYASIMYFGAIPVALAGFAYFAWLTNQANKMMNETGASIHPGGAYEPDDADEGKSTTKTAAQSTATTGRNAGEKGAWEPTTVGE
jgi:hypothetical protein